MLSTGQVILQKLTNAERSEGPASSLFGLKDRLLEEADVRVTCSIAIALPREELSATHFKHFVVTVDPAQPRKKIRALDNCAPYRHQACDYLLAFGDLNLFAPLEETLNLGEVGAEITHADFFHLTYFSIT